MIYREQLHPIQPINSPLLGKLLAGFWKGVFLANLFGETIL